MDSYSQLIDKNRSLPSFEFQSALDLVDQEEEFSQSDSIEGPYLGKKTTINIPNCDQTILLSTITYTGRKYIIMISAQIADELYQEIALNKSGESQLLNNFSGFLGKWTNYPLLGLNGSFSDISTIYFAAKRHDNYQLVGNLSNRMWFDLKNKIQTLEPKILQHHPKPAMSSSFMSEEYLANCYETELKQNNNISSTLVKILLEHNQNVISSNRYTIRNLQDYIIHPNKWGISLLNSGFGIPQKLLHDPKLFHSYVDRYGIHVRVIKDLEQYFFEQFFGKGIPEIVKRYYKDIVIFESDTKIGNDRLQSILTEFGGHTQ